MSKKKVTPHEAMRSHLKADDEAWELLKKNDALFSEIRSLRDKYNLPVLSEDHRKNWFDDNSCDLRDGMERDFQAIISRHNLNSSRWYHPLFSYVLFDDRQSMVSMGIHNREDGTIFVDFSNPHARIEDPAFQLALRIALEAINVDVVPERKSYENHPIFKKGMFDWRPVIEWYYLHPEIPKEERYRRIAKALGLKPGTVKNKFMELNV